MKQTPPAARLRIRTYTPTVVVAPTLAQLLAGKQRGIDVARYLAARIAFHEQGCELPEFHGTDNVLLPVEVIEMAGKLLISGAKWSTEVNDARVEAAHKKDARVQRRASQIWQEDRNLTKSAVAKRIFESGNNEGYAFDTLRLKITKPKNS
jgi:hypothetical protein